MEPDTPGITMVAEATIPSTKRMAMVDPLTGRTARVSPPVFKRGSPADTAKASRKAIMAPAPIFPLPAAFFSFMAL